MIDSTCITRLTIDTADEYPLHLTFPSGRTYAYKAPAHVLARLFLTLKAGGSLGKFVNQHITRAPWDFRELT